VPVKPLFAVKARSRRGGMIPLGNGTPVCEYAPPLDTSACQDMSIHDHVPVRGEKRERLLARNGRPFKSFAQETELDRRTRVLGGKK
jgi:hypothetical protein